MGRMGCTRLFGQLAYLPLGPSGSFAGPWTASFPESPGKRLNFNIIHWFCRFLNWILSLASNASDGQMTHFTTGPESSLFANHGILGVLFFRMLPVSVRKPWHFGSTVFQNAPCSQTMAFWEYCFPECSLFVYYKSGGILEKMPPSKKEQNRQNQCIMHKYTRVLCWTQPILLIRCCSYKYTTATLRYNVSLILIDLSAYYLTVISRNLVGRFARGRMELLQPV